MVYNLSEPRIITNMFWFSLITLMAYCKVNISPERMCLNVIASVIMIVIQVIPENDQNMLPTNQKTAGSKFKQRS